MSIPASFFQGFDAFVGWFVKMLTAIADNWILSLAVFLTIVYIVVDEIVHNRDGKGGY